MYTFVILIVRRLNYYTKLFIPLCHKNEKGRKRKIEMQQRNNHRHSRKKSLNKIHKSADRLKTRTPLSPHCPLCPSLAFHPSPNTITFYTHRKSAVPPRSPILPFRRIQLHTPTLHRECAPTSWHERLLPGRLRIPGAVKFQRRLTSEVRVACWRCTWAVVPHWERERELPSSPPLAQCYTLARGTRE